MSHPPTEADPPQDASSGAMDGAAALRVNHERVKARIAAAARAAGREPADVTLLAVSKTFEAAAVLALAACGQRAFAESYLQEALQKMAACRDQWANRSRDRSNGGAGDGSTADPLVWHFIGPVQSNKTRPIAEAFDWVHSIEREKIAQRLSDQRPESMPPLQVCLQVNVSGEASKSGCAPDEALELAQSIARLPRLRLRGLMTIPEASSDTNVQRARFAILAKLLQEIRAAGVPVDTLSMGMSDDLESAIAEGATIVRVGTALFGRRTDGNIRPYP
jgi:PLP dependent protein